MLIVTGKQGEIWWRLGPQEPTGLLLCLLCMLAIQKYELKPSVIKGISVVALGFLMAASKESFTILLPSLGLFCIGYDFWLNQYSSVWIGIKKTFRKNIGIFIGMLFNLCLNIYVIAYRVGLQPLSYAGIDRNAGIEGYFFMIKEMLKWDSMKIYEILQSLIVVLFLASFVYSAVRKGKKKTEKRAVTKRIGGLLIGLSMFSIMCSQLILYTKSGMSARYLVPFCVGFSFLNLCVLLPGMKNKCCYRITMALTCAFCIFLYGMTWQDGRFFAVRGRRLNDSFEKIEENLEKDDKILICVGGEADSSFALYISMNMGMENICSWTEERGFYPLLGQGEAVQSFEEADCLIFPEGMTLKDYGIDEKEYDYAGEMGYGPMYMRTTEEGRYK